VTQVEELEPLALSALRESLPDLAKDTRINLSATLQSEVLSPAQAWGVALAAAVASRSARLASAFMQDGRARGVSEATLDDARAAAVLMAMNNVYYRFRHVIGKDSYSHKPARLRMQRLVQTSGPKVDFELFSLAASAINGCETCLRSHEQAVLAGGLSEDHVHDAVRIASAVRAGALALELT
jgi:alkyl hydroperoxide reductase subunit D